MSIFWYIRIKYLLDFILILKSHEITERPYHRHRAAITNNVSVDLIIFYNN